jgi:cytochrome oxidase assembly protein ShyY1
MVRRLLTPHWLAIHVLALVLVAGCLWLGHWQLDRAAAFQQSASGASEPGPVPLESVTQPQGVLDGAAIGRLVTVSGRYDQAHAYLVPGQVQKGRSGFWLLSVVRLPSGAGALVVRGWVPTAAAAAVVPAPQAPVVVTGRLMDAQDPSGGLPPGTVLPSGQVAAASPVALLSLVPYQLFDGYVVLISQLPAVQAGLALVPSGRSGNAVPGFYFQHLAYVGLWWLFAAFVVFFWWRLVRDQVAPRPGAPG